MNKTAIRSEDVLLEQVARGDQFAWAELIARFEGRLLAFVASRTGDRTEAEDIVQETFCGLLTSLPNYDRRRPLESYLFSIAAHKLADWLRRRQRRPSLPLASMLDHGAAEPASPARPASSIARSGERRHLQYQALADALAQILGQWLDQGLTRKVACCELLLVRGWANKEVAAALGLSEQAVANNKFELIEKLRGHVRRQRLSPDVFPELYERNG